MEMLLLLFTAIPDGSLLFVENSQNLVESYTNSSYSHVAIVLGGEVYEAEPPKVRTYTIKQWFTNVARYNEGLGSPAIVSIFTPKQPLSEEEVARMKEYLEAQVGRRYSIRGYLRKIEGDGIHCSEMCAAALEATERIDFREPNQQMSPGELHSGTSKHYEQHGDKLYATVKKEYRRSTCERWQDWWLHKGSMCRWSCWETWTFCW